MPAFLQNPFVVVMFVIIILFGIVITLLANALLAEAVSRSYAPPANMEAGGAPNRPMVTGRE